MYTASVIGLGRIGALYPSIGNPRSHTSAYLDNKKVKLIAGVDPNPIARASFRKLWGNNVKLFSSVDEMLSEKINTDIVSICTGPDVINDIVYKFIGNPPKIFFFEKPTVSSVSQGKSLLKLLNGLPVAVNYHRCWDPKHKIFFNNLVNKKIFTVRVLYNKGLMNYASHIIALLLQNFGDVVSISKIPGEKNIISNIDQSYSFILNFRQGFNAIFQGVDDIDYDLLEMDFITSSGIYSLKSGGCRQRHEKPVDGVFYPNYKSLDDSQLNVKDGQVEGLQQAVNNIVYYLDKKTDKLECNLKLSLNIFKIINKVKELY